MLDSGPDRNDELPDMWANARRHRVLLVVVFVLSILAGALIISVVKAAFYTRAAASITHTATVA